MFVEIIKEEDLSGPKIDAWINKAKKDGFALEDAMDVLKKTNYYGVIKKIAKVIKGLKTPEERLAFKEFVLSAVWGRDTSPDTFNLLYNLALEGGYDGEFLEAFTRPKVYTLKKINETSKNFILRGDTQLSDFDFTGLDRAVFDFEGGAKTVTIKDEILPPVCVFKNARYLTFKGKITHLDEFILENVDKVEFLECDEFEAKVIDLSCCDEVVFGKAYFSRNAKIKFKEGADIFSEEFVIFPSELEFPYVNMLNIKRSKFHGVKFKGGKCIKYDNSYSYDELPEILDLSGFDEVDLSNCDFYGVKKVIFKKGAKVDLQGAENITCDMNLDAPKKINLKDCDLTKVTDLSFAEGADVDLSDAIFDASKVDFSVFDKLIIRDVDFSGVKELKFRKGAKIEIIGGENFPKVLDLSNIDIWFSRCNFSGVEDLKVNNSCCVNFARCCEFPKVLDLSNTNISELNGCDFSGVEELKFKGGSSINICCCVGLPKRLDLSGYDEVCLSSCDLAGVDDLKLKDGCLIKFADYCYGFPKVLDLSSAKNVSFSECDFSGIDEIKFGNAENCMIYSSKFCLENFDLSSFKKVEVYSSDFSKVDKMKLGEGSELVFNGLFDTKMPHVLDVSGCSKIDFGYFTNELNKVIFKNKMQRYKVFDCRFSEKIRETLKFKLQCAAKFRYTEEGLKANKKAKTVVAPQKEIGD